MRHRDEKLKKDMEELGQVIGVILSAYARNQFAEEAGPAVWSEGLRELSDALNVAFRQDRVSRDTVGRSFLLIYLTLARTWSEGEALAITTNLFSLFDGGPDA